MTNTKGSGPLQLAFGLPFLVYCSNVSQRRDKESNQWSINVIYKAMTKTMILIFIGFYTWKNTVILHLSEYHPECYKL